MPLLTATDALAGLGAGLAVHGAARALLGQKGPHAAWAPVTAAATAALWLLAAASVPPALVPYTWALATLAVLITVTDLRCRTIPNLALLAAAVLWVPLWLAARPETLAAAAVGALVFAGPLGLAARLRPDGMGLGDVKLAAVLGLYLGVPLAIVGLMLGAVAGGLGGAAVLLRPSASRRDTIPYGPFLAAGAMAALFWGASLLRAYGWG